MHILHVVPNARYPLHGYGGTERVVEQLALWQAQCGWRVSVLCAPGSVIPSVRCVGEEALSDDALARDGVTLIHFHTLRKGFYSQVPHLFTIHGNARVGEVLPLHSVFVSQSHARTHGSTHWVYNGVPAQSYPYLGAPLARRTAMFLAKASWKVKNLLGALQISKRASWKLLVAGGSGLSSSRVRFLGEVSDSKKLDALAKASVLLFPVRWDEPFGLAMVEAMLCGRPVFGTPFGSLPEVVGTEGGFLSASVDELSRALCEFCWTEQMAKRVRERSAELFSVEQMGLGYQAKYELLLRKGWVGAAAPMRVSTHSPENLYAMEELNDGLWSRLTNRF